MTFNEAVGVYFFRLESLVTLCLDDIELIKLEKPVQFSRTISPVCLPEINLPAEQSTCYVIGWGRTGKSYNYKLSIFH